MLILVLRRWDSPRVNSRKPDRLFLLVCSVKKKTEKKQVPRPVRKRWAGQTMRQNNESITRDAGAYGAAVRPQVDTPRQRRQ